MAGDRDDLSARVEAAIDSALAEVLIWHERTTVPIRELIPTSIRGQRRQNILDLLRPAHVVRQQILVGDRLGPRELSRDLPEAYGLEVLLDLFDDKRLRDAYDVSRRELRNVRAARTLADGFAGNEALLAYIDDQIAFFARVAGVSRTILHRRGIRVY